MPVGSAKAEPVDVRVVAATHRELEAEVELGHFREDLFYRLNVFRIKVPALRARPGDVPLLAEAALERLRARNPEAARTTISPLAMRLLRAHRWPGNVRELFSVVESSSIRAGSGRIEAQHLPPGIRDPEGKGTSGSEERYKAGNAEAERQAIEVALAEAKGSRTRAAELLGMSRTTLWRRMKEFGLGDEE